eukprot:415494_1
MARLSECLQFGNSVHYADVLFPGLDRVGWQALSFLHFLGQERELVRYYNRLYSNNAKIPHILKKGADYGFFIDALHDHKRNHAIRDPIHPLVVSQTKMSARQHLLISGCLREAVIDKYIIPELQQLVIAYPCKVETCPK